jgi:hypothetical protein
LPLSPVVISWWCFLSFEKWRCKKVKWLWAGKANLGFVKTTCYKIKQSGLITKSFFYSVFKGVAWHAHPKKPSCFKKGKSVL